MKTFTILFSICIYSLYFPYPLDAETSPIFKLVYINYNKTKKKKDWKIPTSMKITRKTKFIKFHYKPK